MGVLGVDMETSAMYAIGQYRGVKVCNFLVVSDVLGEEWEEAFGTKKLKNANKLARRIIISCLNNEILPKTS
jgi:nucleoside phosphorylase